MASLSSLMGGRCFRIQDADGREVSDDLRRWRIFRSDDGERGRSLDSPGIAAETPVTRAKIGGAGKRSRILTGSERPRLEGTTMGPVIIPTG